MLHTVVWLCLLLSFVNPVKCGPADKYRGHNVVEMVAKNVTTANLLRKFVDGHGKGMDVWTLTPTSCQVDVHPTQIAGLKEFCKENDIAFSVVIKDLEKTIKEHMKKDAPTALRSLAGAVKSPKERTRAEHTTFNYEEYNRFENIVDEIYRLECEYPDIVDVMQIGNSFEKRPLLLVKITSNVLACSRKKDVIWIDGGTHAREWISVATPMWILREFVTKFGKDDQITKLLTDNEILLAPVINPDGYEYTFTGDRLWRKTRTPTKQEGCFGIDANRNWDVEFGGVGTSSDPCSLVYPGEFPEQEPVVKAYADVLRFVQPRLKTYWTLHSFSQFLLSANSYTEVKPNDFILYGPPAFLFATTIRTINGRVYGTGNAVEFQNRLITGVSMDYVHDTLKVPYSYLLELPPSKRNPFGFGLPASEIKSVSDEVFTAMLITFNRIDEIIAIQNQIPITTTTTTTPTTTTTAPTTTTTTPTTTTTTTTSTTTTTTPTTAPTTTATAPTTTATTPTTTTTTSTTTTTTTTSTTTPKTTPTTKTKTKLSHRTISISTKPVNF